MIIRNEQMDAFRKAQQDRFFRNILKNTREHHPGLCADKSDDSVLQTIAWAAKKARTYSLIMPEDVTRFVYFILRYGRDYASCSDMSWAVDILNDLSLIGSQKLDRIEEASQKRRRC